MVSTSLTLFWIQRRPFKGTRSGANTGSTSSNTALGERVIQIQCAFNDAEPYMFQGQARWYGSRYYVMPVGGTSWTGEFGLRRLLICDMEAAVRASGGILNRNR